MSDQKFQRFGKYLILDHLVDGGMAKICRARHLGEQANKIVAIKMVQEKFSKDESFVQMFEDELKVTFGLLHPNIAQVYDYGIEDKQLYTAMEYVDGANLKQFLDRLKDKNFVFPVEISTYIISQVCQALHYAHTFTDKLTGKPFRIIHRDISPHNIMLAYDGTVKVIDFGIAKADSNSEATQAGTIKGKLSYLAPEYLEGLELDHKYDQFAVGITLWEMLCSRKLFTAKNDLAVLKQIQSCNVPKPSSINPNVPKELDEIVLKALSKDRMQRFENMDKFNRALVKFLYSNYPDFNATDLGYFAKQLFKEEITADKKKFVEFGKIDIKPYLMDIEKPAAVTPDNSSNDQELIKSEKIEIDFGKLDNETSNIEPLKLEVSGTNATKKKVLKKDKTSTRQSIKAKQAPPIEVEEKTSKSRKVSVNRIKSTDRRDKTSISRRRRVEEKETSNSKKIIPVLVVAGIAGFFFLKMNNGDVSSQKKITRDPSSNPELVKQEKGVLTFRNYSPDMRVYLNNKLTKVKGIEVELEVGKQYTLEIKRKGYKKFVYPTTITLTEKNGLTSLTIPEMEIQKIGFLSTSLNFTSGSKIEFSIDGEKVVKELPLKNERIPAGTYNAKITNPLLGTERNVVFTIEQDKRNFLK